MSKETREHLSCLVDGEISRETSRFLVRRLAADSELRAVWSRYHLVRDCMRHQDGGIADGDLCARVGKALENESPVRSAWHLSTRWLKPAAGLAIAATVALMAVVAVEPYQPAAPGAGGQVAGESATEAFTSPQIRGPAPYSSQASLNGQSNRETRKMNSYLVRHYQASEATGGRSFVHFVPIVITHPPVPANTAGPADENTQAEDDREEENTLK
jgi:sigma-E factor negative regulatory protein RseA